MLSLNLSKMNVNSMVIVSIILVHLVNLTIVMCADTEEVANRNKRDARAQIDDSDPTIRNMLNSYNIDTSSLLQYTPSTPSPSEVNCHVEVPITTRHGGRCVSMGRARTCQAGVYLGFDPACMETSNIPTARPWSNGRRRGGSRRRRLGNLRRNRRPSTN